MSILSFQASLSLLAMVVQCFHANAQTTQVIAWGSNSSGQRDVPPLLTNAVALCSYSYHNLALRADGTVTGWGASWEPWLAPKTFLRMATRLHRPSWPATVASRHRSQILIAPSWSQSSDPRAVRTPRPRCGGSAHSVISVGSGGRLAS